MPQSRRHARPAFEINVPHCGRSRCAKGLAVGGRRWVHLADTRGGPSNVATCHTYSEVGICVIILIVIENTSVNLPLRQSTPMKLRRIGMLHMVRDPRQPESGARSARPVHAARLKARRSSFRASQWHAMRPGPNPWNRSRQPGLEAPLSDFCCFCRSAFPHP